MYLLHDGSSKLTQPPGVPSMHTHLRCFPHKPGPHIPPGPGERREAVPSALSTLWVLVHTAALPLTCGYPEQVAPFHFTQSAGHNRCTHLQTHGTGTEAAHSVSSQGLGPFPESGPSSQPFSSITPSSRTSVAISFQDLATKPGRFPNYNWAKAENLPLPPPLFCPGPRCRM